MKRLDQEGGARGRVMSEQSERMMLLLKELAILKEQEAVQSVEGPGGDTARRRRRKEISRQIKQIAEEKRKSNESK